MTYQYNVSTNTIWTSFDYGEVEADSIEDATLKATALVKNQLEIANLLLEKINYSIGIDLSQIQVTIKKSK